MREKKKVPKNAVLRRQPPNKNQQIEDGGGLGFGLVPAALAGQRCARVAADLGQQLGLLHVVDRGEAVVRSAVLAAATRRILHCGVAVAAAAAVGKGERVDQSA